MKKILTFAVAAMIATVSMAQMQGKGQRRQREINPEEMAMMQTKRLSEAVELDSIQFQAVFLMNYADALTMQDSINARRERAEKMRAEGKKPERKRPTEEQMNAMIELRKQREEVRKEQMKKILNAEQYEKYLEFRKAEREKMRHSRDGRRGGRNGQGARRGGTR